MLPTREGYFNAYPTNIGVDETGANNLATVIIAFRCFEELQPDGQWSDCSAEGFEITGYFYLEKKNGDINTSAIEHLKEAFGWDGRDPFWLQDTDFSQHPVQLCLGFEEWNGKNRIKVQWLNPYGSEPGGGGVSKADESTKRAISNRLGSKLRSISGGTPAAAPRPAAPKPTMPAAAAPKAAPPAKAPPKAAAKAKSPPQPAKAAESTMDAAWEAFTAAVAANATTAKWTQEQVEGEWFRILAEMYPDRDADSFTPAEWGAVTAEIAGKIIPF